jgi:uracil-DNA glycosylase
MGPEGPDRSLVRPQEPVTGRLPGPGDGDVGNRRSCDPPSLASELAGGAQEASPLERIAWTNLARIGYARGNPEGAAFRVQADVCKRLIAAELDWLRPEVVVLATGNFQHRFVTNFFSEADWKALPGAGHDDAWVCTSHGAVIVWTGHPQGKSTARLEGERRAIVEVWRQHSPSSP